MTSLKSDASLRTAGPQDLQAISKFLARVYGSSVDRSANEKLEWKYLVPRSGWNGSRSYLLAKDGEIMAHCGVCPVLFNLPSGETVESLTMMDWAADSSVPGAGVMLFRKVMGMAATSFVIGGSAVTRKIAPRIGFRLVGEAPTYAAWVRPWHEFRLRGIGGRSVLRLVHGWTHRLRDRTKGSGDWVATRVSGFDETLVPVLHGRKRSWTSCHRTVEDLNYLLKCPDPEMTGFLLKREGRIAGYFIVGISGWEARILDVVVDADDVSAWKGGCSAMTRAVQQMQNVCRIRVQATFPVLQQALTWSGYWLQYKEPIFVHDQHDALARAFPVGFQLFDGDSGYSSLSK